MRTETITKTYCLFNELPKDRQLKEIEKVRCDEYYLYYEWYDFIEDDFKTILELLGFYDIKTYFSGFYSQGDGASFEAKWTREKFLTKKIKDYAPKDEELHRIAKELMEYPVNTCGEVSRTTFTMYYHSNTMDAELDYDTPEKFTEYVLEECSRDLAEWYYSRLYEHYEYLMSDEAIAEHLIANEYEYEL